MISPGVLRVRTQHRSRPNSSLANKRPVSVSPLFSGAFLLHLSLQAPTLGRHGRTLISPSPQSLLRFFPRGHLMGYLSFLWLHKACQTRHSSAHFGQWSAMERLDRLHAHGSVSAVPGRNNRHPSFPWLLATDSTKHLLRRCGLD